MKVIHIGLPILTLGAISTFADESAYIEPKITDKDREHWAFRPISNPPIPEIEGANHPIDSFLLKKLRDLGLDGFAPEAESRTLLRRLTFDLTGLPPTPEQLASVSNGPADSKTVDSLLNSKAYGERWAQHWLDVARFAETDGFEHDKVRKDAWRYRDWVINAFNADLPYDQFVRLQIAGDKLAARKPNAALATGFLFSGPDMPDINLAAERRHQVLNELTGTVGSAFLGLALSCSQCHDHKSDPISQADFYRMRAYFDNLSIPAKGKSLPHVVSEQDNENPQVSHLFIRGDFRSPGPELQADVLRVVDYPDSNHPPSSRQIDTRDDLATWITSPSNPLTARVIMNRLWMHHFGKPLVDTPSDFGTLGGRPSHPELLDWLAGELIRRDWSLKSMHHLILSSQAWRQSSRELSQDKQWKLRLKNDPDNQWLSRQNRQRLDGEAIRDAMLMTSNQLNRKAGGPGIRPPLPPEVTVTLLKNQWPVTEDASQHHRRSIYLFVRRNLRYPLFDVFDRPDGNQSCSRRHESTTAPQSLTLLNSDFAWSMANALIKSIQSRSEAKTDGINSGNHTDKEFIHSSYERVLSRAPSKEEIELGSKFISQKGRQAYALALFNLNEFVYLD